MTSPSAVIRAHAADNVAIVTNAMGLTKGTRIQGDLVLNDFVSFGHKVAISPIQKGAEVLRYGETIGTATKNIAAGDPVDASAIDLLLPPEMTALRGASRRIPAIESLTGYTFEGYRNPDGSVGTRNVLGITTSVQCVAGVVDHVVDRVRKELLPLYPNVDDVVAIKHSYGCGVAIDVPAAIIPIRTIRHLALNPNFGGEVMIVGLGCEKLQPERIFPEMSGERADSTDCGVGGCGCQVQGVRLQDRNFRGFEQMVQGILDMAERRLARLNQRRRETCPVSDLVVGTQCGGSDAFSGVTANPAVGVAADLIVRAGGSVFFSEVTEVRDAIHLLVPRTVTDTVAQQLVEQMRWYDDYLALGRADRTANPTPGNKVGGISNVIEKALGSIVKSGTSPIVGVVAPGERITERGLNFVATPASDFICGTLQAAAGMNLHVFTTGRGTPYGLAMMPVVKVSSNTALSRRWHDLIDLDAGEIASGDKTVEQVGWELFELILDIASGRKQAAAEKLGLHNDMVLFNPGPVT